MTHEELLARIDEEGEFLVQYFDSRPIVHSALRAVVAIHRPFTWNSSNPHLCCMVCDTIDDGDLMPAPYPCPTIQAIEKELK